MMKKLREMQVMLAVRAYPKCRRHTRTGGVHRRADHWPDKIVVTPDGKHELIIEAKGRTGSDSKALLEACKQLNKYLHGIELT